MLGLEWCAGLGAPWELLVCVAPVAGCAWWTAAVAVPPAGAAACVSPPCTWQCHHLPDYHPCRLPLLPPAAAAFAADTILAVVAPKAPPRSVREAVAGSSGADAEDEADELLRLRLPHDAPQWQRRAVHLLLHRLRLPEVLLALALRLGWRFWGGLLAWMAGARLAAAYGLGPVYVIGTIFAGMLLNLGTRQEGQWSAYSLFNPGMRRLPGQMTAEDLDAQIRRGNM